ncbi:hypothetical protein BJY04DRAFT_169811 [Aspergillus karnatakaensis]|uniref:uncharacterized protein n=1 Tax=Aspergillus karnatakaensis TaxID=1810916 RepID=UPI003CCD77EE
MEMKNHWIKGSLGLRLDSLFLTPCWLMPRWCEPGSFLHPFSLFWRGSNGCDPKIPGISRIAHLAFSLYYGIFVPATLSNPYLLWATLQNFRRSARRAEIITAAAWIDKGLLRPKTDPKSLCLGPRYCTLTPGDGILACQILMCDLSVYTVCSASLFVLIDRPHPYTRPTHRQSRASTTSIISPPRQCPPGFGEALIGNSIESSGTLATSATMSLRLVIGLLTCAPNRSSFSHAT